jgi:hypothetical protein
MHDTEEKTHMLTVRLQSNRLCRTPAAAGDLMQLGIALGASASSPKNEKQ